jgi:hypothetical protein
LLDVLDIGLAVVELPLCFPGNLPVAVVALLDRRPNGLDALAVLVEVLGHLVGRGNPVSDVFEQVLRRRELRIGPREAFSVGGVAALDGVAFDAVEFVSERLGQRVTVLVDLAGGLSCRVSGIDESVGEFDQLGLAFIAAVDQLC